MNLPDDIVGEILSRLPAKEIGRCRCVSKSIRSLTMEPFFIKAHSQHSISSGSSRNKPFFVTNSNLNHKRKPNSTADGETKAHAAVASLFDFKSPPFSFGPPNEYLMLVGCSGGLVCLSKYGALLNRTGMYPNSIYLWNPSLGGEDFIELHPSIPENYSELLSFGFGYDSVNDDYKVLNLKQGPSKSEVYSLRNGTWKRISQLFPLHGGRIKMPHETDEAVTVNGFMHWPCRGWYYDNNTGFKESVKPALVCFNLAGEVFDWLSFPEELERCVELRLAKLSGQLCAYCCTEGDLNLWVMTTYGVAESWVQQYLLPLHDQYSYHLLKGITLRREIILLDDRGTLDLYDPDNTGQKISTFHLGLVSITPFVADYVESLISVASPLYHSRRKSREQETKGEAEQEQEQGRNFLANLVGRCFGLFTDLRIIGHIVMDLYMSFTRKKFAVCKVFHLYK